MRIMPILALCLVAGCKSLPKEERKPAAGTSSSTLSSVVDHTNDSVESIKDDAASIRDDTKVVREALSISVLYDESIAESGRDVSPVESPRPSDVAVDTLAKIDARAVNIEEAADAIGKENERLKGLADEVEDLERSLTSLRLALEETRLKALEKLYGYISMFWVIGFVLIAAGAAVAFFLSKTYGGSLAMIGVLMLGFASASQYYMQEIALVGAVLLVTGFLASIAMIVWSTAKSKRDSTAITEIVEMIEVLKETMTDSERERIFGEQGLASKVQSDLTRQIVSRVKERNGFRKLAELQRVPAVNPASVPTGERKSLRPSP